MIKPNADITKVNTDLNKMLYDYKVAKDMKIMNKTVQEYEAAIGGKAELFITRLDRMKLEAKGGGLEKQIKRIFIYCWDFQLSLYYYLLLILLI